MRHQVRFWIVIALLFVAGVLAGNVLRGVYEDLEAKELMRNQLLTEVTQLHRLYGIDRSISFQYGPDDWDVLQDRVSRLLESRIPAIPRESGPITFAGARLVPNDDRVKAVVTLRRGDDQYASLIMLRSPEPVFEAVLSQTSEEIPLEAWSVGPTTYVLAGELTRPQVKMLIGLTRR
ncbi:MAG: hypothetical protein ACE363_08905 [Alphaproteobacteria bacterium]